MTMSGDYPLITTAHSYPIVQNIITGIGKKISHIKIENDFFLYLCKLIVIVNGFILVLI